VTLQIFDLASGTYSFERSEKEFPLEQREKKKPLICHCNMVKRGLIAIEGDNN